MRTPELDAIRHARARRKRLARPLLMLTGSVGLMTVALFLVLPGSSPFRARTATMPPPSASAAPEAAPDVLVVRVHGGTITLDGAVLAQTAGIERLERIPPLYDALKQRLVDLRMQQPGAPAPRLVLDVAADERAIVVKSVFQTAAFAGYPDIAFALPDGGVVGPKR